MTGTESEAKTYVNPLDKITEGRELPEGCTHWGIRSVHPDLRSSNGFRWPFPGTWTEAPGPINTANTNGYPSDIGDGICLAHTWRGMASGDIPALTLLLCAYNESDTLGRAKSEQKIRVQRAYVVDVIDGQRLLKEWGASADLYGANLTGANLRGADLRYANLYGADLRGADLYGANLYSANLCGANLYDADLYGANLRDANLRDADLYGADLRGANLKNVIHNQYTRWPEEFDIGMYDK